MHLAADVRLERVDFDAKALRAHHDSDTSLVVQSSHSPSAALGGHVKHTPFKRTCESRRCLAAVLVFA